jgi:hypothetical protein
MVAIAKNHRAQITFWFSLSLLFALFYAILALHEAFGHDYVVQDDARQHVFWTYRFLDSELFQQDLLADYFQSVAPRGYTSVYRLFAGLGVDPIWLHKLLPAGISLLVTIYGFGVSQQLLPLPMAGFFTTLLLNQSLWMKDDLSSATPVAFVCPIFLAFLYYLMKERLWPCLVAIAIQGLFYPQCVFIFAGVLILRLWQRSPGGKWQWSDRRWDYQFSGAGLVVVVLVMLPYLLQSSEFGPTISATAARSLPTFAYKGWSEFFVSDWWKFWACGKRSGMFPSEWCRPGYGAISFSTEDQDSWIKILFGVPQVVFGLALPWLLKRPQRFPLAAKVSNKVTLLPRVLLVSISLYFVAHLLLFRLHLPNRYTEHSFRIVSALAAGIAVTLIFDALLRAGMGVRRSQHRNRRFTAQGLIIVLTLVLVLYPHSIRFGGRALPITGFQIGQQPQLYQFFAQQPKDILIASLSPEVNNLPSFSRRSIFVGSKGFTLPYHVGYYRQASQRIAEVMQAQYTPDLAQLQAMISRTGIDFWLLEKSAFAPNYLDTNVFAVEYASVAQPLKTQVQAGTQPALAQVAQRCTVFQAGDSMVIDTKCITEKTAA